MKIYNILWCAAIMAVFSACSEDEYKLYDTTQKDSVFFEYRDNANKLVEEVSYAFNYDIANSHTIEVPVTLMGVPKNVDRVISVVPLADETTMKEGVNYTITNNVIPANAVKGVVYVNLLRDLDPEILEMEKSVKLTINESDDLKSVGENYITITYSDIRPTTRPSWWLTYYTCPVYSYENAQLFFKYFYEFAPKANIDLFNEIVAKYGDYFVKATNVQGPFTNYEKFIRNYVCIPLYRDHPELQWQGSPEW